MAAAAGENVAHPLGRAEMAPDVEWSLRGGRRLRWGRDRTAVMGVLNLTPDSFSDGGRWLEPGVAVERALLMIDAGADVIDLGAESTRPGGGVYGAGAEPLDEDDELERLLPVLEALRPLTDRPLSIDTRKAGVARRALAAGADLINDVDGLRDPDLVRVVAKAGCPVIAMHSRGDLRTMQVDTHYDELLTEIVTALDEAVARAVAAGIPRSRIAVDPGIGFGKNAEQNLELLAHFDRLHSIGCPVVIGASRKSFIGTVTGASVDRRLGGSLAAAAWALDGGAHLLRVHDVAETRQFVDLWRAIDRSRHQAAARASQGTGS